MTRTVRFLLASLLVAVSAGALADAPLVDRDAVFARARAIAAAQLPETAGERLLPFAIEYRLTLLETGRPEGAFEVDLLIAGSRSVIPAAELIAAAPEAAEKARLEQLLAGVTSGYFYRTVKARFPETGENAPAAVLSTILLNRDPEATPVPRPEGP